MNRQDRFNGFHFDNDLGFNQQVDPIAKIDVQSVVGDGQRLLTFEGNAHAGELMSETGVVHAFEQSRTKLPMHTVSSSQNGRRRAFMYETVTSVRASGRVLRGDGYVLRCAESSQEEGQL
jgi:hypothetical protein